STQFHSVLRFTQVAAPRAGAGRGGAGLRSPGSPRASAAVALTARMPTRWRGRAGAPRFDEGGAPSPCSPEVCALHATPRVRIAVAAESSLLRAFQDVHPSTLGEDYCLGGTGIRNSESEHHVGRLRDADLVA